MTLPLRYRNKALILMFILVVHTDAIQHYDRINKMGFFYKIKSVTTNKLLEIRYISKKHIMINKRLLFLFLISLKNLNPHLSPCYFLFSRRMISQIHHFTKIRKHINTK